MEAILKNKELADSLAINIGIIAKYLEKEGFSTEVLDQVVSDCHELIESRIKQIGNVHPADVLNIERVVNMVMLHTFISQDLKIIKEVAAIRRTSEGDVAKEWVKETVKAGMSDRKVNPLGRKIPVE